MTRVEVISGLERRRRWSQEQKRAIVAEAFAPGASVSAVARRVDVGPGQIYRWRRELCSAAVGFAKVVVSPSSYEGAQATGSAIVPSTLPLFHSSTLPLFHSSTLPDERCRGSCA